MLGFGCASASLSLSVHLQAVPGLCGADADSAQAVWEEALPHGIPPSPLDGIYFENQQELNTRFPALGNAGFGRKW